MVRRESPSGLHPLEIASGFVRSPRRAVSPPRCSMESLDVFTHKDTPGGKDPSHQPLPGTRALA